MLKKKFIKFKFKNAKSERSSKQKTATLRQTAELNLISRKWILKPSIKLSLSFQLSKRIVWRNAKYEYETLENLFIK